VKVSLRRPLCAARPRCADAATSLLPLLLRDFGVLLNLALLFAPCSAKTA
jgi:hypothetical protein